MGIASYSFEVKGLVVARYVCLDNDKNCIVHQIFYSMSTKNSESRRHRAVFYHCMSLFGVNLIVFRVGQGVIPGRIVQDQVESSDLTNPVLSFYLMRLCTTELNIALRVVDS